MPREKLQSYDSPRVYLSVKLLFFLRGYTGHLIPEWFAQNLIFTRGVVPQIFLLLLTLSLVGRLQGWMIDNQVSSSTG